VHCYSHIHTHTYINAHPHTRSHSGLVCVCVCVCVCMCVSQPLSPVHKSLGAENLPLDNHTGLALFPEHLLNGPEIESKDPKNRVRPEFLLSEMTASARRIASAFHGGGVGGKGGREGGVTDREGGREEVDGNGLLYGSGAVLGALASPVAQTIVAGSGVDGMRSVETPRAG
jgi:hypothetical protein